MRSRHWLIGLTLCFAGIGGASATSLATQSVDNGDHATVDDSAAHLSEGGGDALGLSHNSVSRDSGDEHSDTVAPSSQQQRGGGVAAPATPASRSHMSWQSLLPGSIQ